MADVPWALFDGHRLVQSGRGPAATWPHADAREAVIAASAVRVVHVALPPMPADRIPQAIAFALEDQLAGPAGGHHLAASKRDGDGVDVAIVARPVIAPLARSFDRVVAEPAVAPKAAAGAWRWYRSGASGGFVRRHDGSAFATSSVEVRGALPPELALPLRHAARAAPTLTRVETAFAVDDAQLRTWSEDAGVAFVRTDAWRWDQDGAALAAAFDLLQGDYSRAPRAAPLPLRTRVRWAAGLAIAAVLDPRRGERRVVGIVALSRVASAARGGRHRAHRGRRGCERSAASSCRAGRAPCRGPSSRGTDRELRRVAPSRARRAFARAVTPGALKSATYAANTWTLDLGKVDPAVAASVDRNLAGTGLATLAATTPAGTRMRVGAVIMLRESWQRLSAREQRMVAFAAHRCARRHRVGRLVDSDERRRRPADAGRAADGGLAGVARVQADDIVALARAPAPARLDPLPAVERALAERNLRGAVSSLDMQDGRVRLTFAMVRFDALPPLLDTLARGAGLVPPT